MLTTISQRKIASIVEQLSYYPSYCHLGSILDAYRCRTLDCTRSTGIAKPHRSILSRMCTALSSFMADMRASFNASSLSVLRLTLDYVQASSLVEHTIVLSPRLSAKSLIQPEGPHASMTTRSAGYEITALSVATCSEQSRDRAFQDPRQNAFAGHRLDVWDRLVPAVDVD